MPVTVSAAPVSVLPLSEIKRLAIIHAGLVHVLIFD
jgi:hypothetical protein